MAEYLEKPSKLKRIHRSFMKPLAGFFIAVIALTGAISTSALVKHDEAHADIINDLVCDNLGIPWLSEAFGPESDNAIFGKGTFTHTIYRMTHTDDLHFAFESKSTVNAGTEDVDGLLNQFISWGKSESFTKANERILGVDMTTGQPEGAPNSGSRVTAFDRFGLAGLSWTRYNGEWRYPYVDVCSSSEPRDLKLSVFYDGRLEPMTTYSGIHDTKDVRTSQFGEGIAQNLGEGFLNTTANWLFSITKWVVALAIALVNLSFADFVDILGLNELIGADDGIFANLYRGIYQPLIGIVMGVLGLLMLYKGVVKRQYRGALGLLFRSIALFISSIIIFAAPLFFISLPNNAAVIAQSLIINSMSTGLASGSGICTLNGDESSVIEANPDGEPTDVTDAKEAQDLLGKASSNMRSIVGCQLWSTFLVKPWSIGQFGADYNMLYADGHIPSGAYGKTGELVIDNDEMVGDAAVPVGGGDFIYNWALFQISTGTNAHSPLAPTSDDAGEVPAGLSPYTNGIANDWYRIVDALSNYNETEEEIQDGVTTSNDRSIDSITIAVPDLTKKPTEYWSTWVGGNSLQRIGVALTSIFAAGAGLLTVVIFGFLSAIYAFGIVLVMAFAPLFFLAGSWGDRGWEIFKGWAQLLLNLVVKRVVIGTILVLNLILLTTVLNMMGDQDYFWGVAALALVSFLLWKFKDKIIDTLGGLFTFNFANENLDSKMSAVTGKLKGNVRKGTAGITNLGVAGVAGGIAAKRNGANFSTGMLSGLKREAKNQAYLQDSQVVRTALRTAESFGSVDGSEICPFCGQTLYSDIGDEGKVVVDSDGNKWHIGCANEKFGDPSEIPMDWAYQDIKIGTDGKSKPIKTNKPRTESYVDKLEPKDVKVSLAMKNRNTVRPGVLVGKELAKDMRSTSTIPEIPEMLRPYLTSDSIIVIDLAIRSGDPRQLEKVIMMYAQALVLYAYEQKIATPGHYSDTPQNAGSEQEDVQAVYEDMLEQFK